jgi:hypothetical protein
VSVCNRPLDPIDAQALAVGAEPLVSSDAADHARSCAPCATLVEEASRLSRGIEDLPRYAPPPDLADRVLRLRAFSRRELRDLSLWRGPSLLSGGVFLAGLVVLALPGLTAREQASLSLAAGLPVLALLKALARAAVEALRATPTGVEALSQTLSGRESLGILCLMLLAPLAFGLRRVLARAPRR